MIENTLAPTVRFEFIGHALRGDGPFRPRVAAYFGDSNSVMMDGESYLTRYPRESDQKYARRNQVAFYDSPLSQACSRFVGYLSTKPPSRDWPHDLYERMAEDIDGKGNAIGVFWQQFTTEAKARGSMLMLVDMPTTMPRSLAEQIATRKVPRWSPIAPELLTNWTIGEDGKFAFAEFRGVYTHPDDKQEPCIWHFDRFTWNARSEDKKGTLLADGEHQLGECPLIIWTEAGTFPCFGSFAPIADISKRLFNLESELDEILRSQTFSLLTMQVPEDTDEEQKLLQAQTAGQTIGTSNLIVHSGSTPAFIAPPDGPAKVYIERIDKLRTRVDIIGLNVATVDEEESGIAMQMRFQQINGELAYTAIRNEDLERRAWDLSARWLGLSTVPTVEWSRDYQIADIIKEMQILTDMQAAAMPPAVVAEQQRRIVQIQFGGLEDAAIADLLSSIDEREQGEAQVAQEDGGNVVPLNADRNSGVRDAIVKALNG